MAFHLRGYRIQIIIPLSVIFNFQKMIFQVVDIILILIFQIECFFQYNQRETITEAFQKTLRSFQGLRETSFILKPISHDVWEQIVTLIGPENIVKNKGVRGQDIVTDELISKNISIKDIQMLHINDMTLLYSFLGSSYSYYTICPASDSQGVQVFFAHVF